MALRNERVFVGKWEYFPLHRSCVKGNYEKVSRLLESGLFDVNEHEDNDLSPVECVLIGRKIGDSNESDVERLQIIEMLLNKGAKDQAAFLNVCTFSNSHPFISELNICKSFIARAINQQYEKAVEFFLKIINASIKPGSEVIYKCNATNESSDRSETSQIQKAFDFFSKYLKKTDNKISNDNNVAPEHICYYTEALKYASLYSNIEIVKMILNEGWSHIDKPSRSQAISNALFAKNFDVALLLLKNNEEILTKISTQNCLRDVAESGHFDILKLLVRLNNKDKVKSFLSSEDDMELKWVPDTLPLQLAAKSGNHGVVKLLVENGCDPFVIGVCGKTTMHYVADGGNLKSLIYLIELGISWKRCDHNNISPLHIAAEQGHYEIVIYLLNLGSDPKKKDSNGRTSLHCSADQVRISKLHSDDYLNLSKDPSKNKAITEVRKFEIFKILLNSGCDPLELDNDGKSILHYACLSGNSKIVNFILNTISTDINIKDHKHKEPPLHLAAKYGHTDLCKMLIESGADINAVDKQGRSILHKAVESDNLPTIELIAGYIHDVDIKDYDDQTALQITTDYNNCFVKKYDEKITEFLLRKGADPSNHSLYKFHESIYSPNILFLDVTAICRILTALYDYGERNEPLHDFYELLREPEKTSILLTGFNDDLLFYVVYKLKAATIASAKAENRIDSFDSNNFRYKMCEREIETMKNKKLTANSNISYYGFIRSSLKCAASMIMDEEVEEAFNSREYEQFEIYSDLLECKFNRAKHMKKLIEKAISFFVTCVPTEPKLKVDSIHILISYLNIKDLTNLSKVTNQIKLT